MELEQFLERNILEFLDSKMEKKRSSVVDREEDYGLYLTKDYIKELDHALDNDEITKAKTLFEELKDTHNRLPKNSIERKKIYAMLEKMYNKIESYMSLHYAKNVPVTSLNIDDKKLEEIESKELMMERNLEQLKSKVSAASGAKDLPIIILDKRAEEKKALKGGPQAVEMLKKKVEKKYPDGKIKSDEKIKKYVMERPKEISSAEIMADTKEKTALAKKPLAVTAKAIAIKKDKKEEKPLIFVQKTEKKVEKQKEEKKTDEKPFIIIKKPLVEESRPAAAHAEAGKPPAIQPKTDIVLPEEDKDVKEKELTLPRISETSGEPIVYSYNSGSDYKTVKQLYESGLKNMFTHKYEEAISSFEKILDVKPYHRAAKIRLLECREAMNNG